MLVVNTSLDENDGAATLMLPMGDPAGPDGLLSLREAMHAANFYAGADTITFNIPVGDPGDNGQWWTIRLDPALNAADGGGLPALFDDGTHILGQTQPGYDPNDVVGTGGTVGVDNLPLPQYPKPKIAIEGRQAPNTFQIDNSASDIRLEAMSVYDSENAIKASVYGAVFTVGTNRVVERMFLGVLPNGADPMTLLPEFVNLPDPPPLLGGIAPRNTGFGVVLDDSTPDFITPPTIDTNLIVQNNFVGFNGFSGIVSRQEFLGPYCKLIVTGNEVFSNGWNHLFQDGIVFGGRNSLARGNLSRDNTTATGLPRGQGGGGFEMENIDALFPGFEAQALDAGDNLIENNTSAHNISSGVSDIQGQDGNQIIKNVIFGNQVGISINQELATHPPTNRILISQNSVFLNFSLGIDLEDQQTVGPWELFGPAGGRNPLAGPPGSTTPFLDGVTPNDPLDGDTYSNDLQNWPVLTSALTTTNQTAVEGTLASTPLTTFSIEFFWTPDIELFHPDDREGHFFLGQRTVTTDAAGIATFQATFGTGVPDDSRIFATARVIALPSPAPEGTAINDTSEYSNGVAVTELPGAGFVTGGGFINPTTVVTSSPAVNASDHRANYGFNAKFHNGDPVPKGHTNFVWKPGNIHFGSTSYAPFSLVVTGGEEEPQQARWRGLGKLNNKPGYGFEVNVTDNGEPGTADTFRIHIWKEVDMNPFTEEGTIYDNGSDVTETIVSGGNIQIHMKSNAEEAANGIVSGATDGGELTQEQLDAAVEQAIVNWQSSGLPQELLDALTNPTVQIVDFSDSLLGLAAGTVIGIDLDAAGYSWFTDLSSGAAPPSG